VFRRNQKRFGENHETEKCSGGNKKYTGGFQIFLEPPEDVCGTMGLLHRLGLKGAGRMGICGPIGGRPSLALVAKQCLLRLWLGGSHPFGAPPQGGGMPSSKSPPSPHVYK
jgi:hypothetical protein